MAGQPFAGRVEREIKIFAALLRCVHQSTLSITDRGMKTLFILFSTGWSSICFSVCETKTQQFGSLLKNKSEKKFDVYKKKLITGPCFIPLVFKARARSVVTVFKSGVSRAFAHTPTKTYFAFNTRRHFLFGLMKWRMNFLIKREEKPQVQYGESFYVINRITLYFISSFLSVELNVSESTR